MIRINEVKLPLDGAQDALLLACCKRLHLPKEQVLSCTLSRKAVDCRKKNDVHFVCNADVTVKGNEQKLLRTLHDSKIQIVSAQPYRLPAHKPLKKRPIVVGLGPAGLFAALLLAQAGEKPLVLERGKAVEARAADVEIFQNGGAFCPQSNIQFGEGGAGAFSDGKLNTGTKDPRIAKVFAELLAAGAPPEIATDAKPHVGTDRLPQVVKTVRQTICSLGGEVLFGAQLVDFCVRDGKLQSITYAQNSVCTTVETDACILAIGHSARDTFALLKEKGVSLQQKAFSMGARIEHPQALINKARYGSFAWHPALEAADYKLSVHLPDGRGVYTFCMCPGGYVVPAASEEGGVVTNGMSRYARDGENANSALLVGVLPDDFGSDDVLAGMQLQRRIEQATFLHTDRTYFAPAQRVEDFLQDRVGTLAGEVTPTYLPGVVPCRMTQILPEYITGSMRQALPELDRLLPGFALPDAILTAPETRSSCPVRIVRNEQLQSENTVGLFPCGEGAGYAGGIVSAAVDGLRCAEAVLAAGE